MRTIFLVTVVAMLSVQVEAAETLDRQKLASPVTSGQPPSLKGARAGNPCAVYGPGFAKIDGTDTCVKIGGAVSIGVGGSVGPH